MSRTNPVDVRFLIKAAWMSVMKHRSAGHLSEHAMLIHTAMFSSSLPLCVYGFQQVTVTCKSRGKLLNAR